MSAAAFLFSQIKKVTHFQLQNLVTLYLVMNIAKICKQNTNLYFIYFFNLLHFVLLRGTGDEL